MNRKKKNKIEYFYQILSDNKNNIDTLVSDLYRERYSVMDYFKNGPSTVYKSKYPDLTKLGILTKEGAKWSITDLGNDLLDRFERKDGSYPKLLASIIGSYNISGFRPYAVFVKYLYIKYGLENKLVRKDIVKDMDLPIREIMNYINDKKIKFEYVATLDESPRPYSYIINFLKSAELLIDKDGELFLTENTKDFLNIFFTEIDEVPKSKIDSTYQIISNRGSNQVEFRKQLLEIYSEKCAITSKSLSIHDNSILEAAHIIPVSHGGSYDVVNGILLSPNMHKSFDRGAFTINEDYEIIIHKNTKENNFFVEDHLTNLPGKESEHPSTTALKYHTDFIFGYGISRLNNK